MSESLVSLFDECELDTLLGKQRDHWLLALSNDEAVVDSGGEGVTSCVLDVSNVEGARVLLNVLEDAYSADVVTTDDENLGAVLKLDQAFDLAVVKVQLQSRGY